MRLQRKDMQLITNIKWRHKRRIGCLVELTKEELEFTNECSRFC
jgi:hypothetical protein